jgi:hypothetical protein
MKNFDKYPSSACADYFNSHATFEEAWNSCICGEWMLYIAAFLVDDKLLTKAKAMCADTVRKYMTDGDSVAALDAALQYAAGEISREELNSYVLPAQKATAYPFGERFDVPDSAINSAANSAASAAEYREEICPDVGIGIAKSAENSARFASDAEGSYAYHIDEDMERAVSESKIKTANICKDVLTTAVFEKLGLIPETPKTDEAPTRVRIGAKIKIDIKKFNPSKSLLENFNQRATLESWWRTCMRGDWMLWLASKLCDDRTFTRAKVRCAGTVSHLITDKRSADALSAAAKYGEGEISREELNKYVSPAKDVCHSAFDVALDAKDAADEEVYLYIADYADANTAALAARDIVKARAAAAAAAYAAAYAAAVAASAADSSADYNPADYGMAAAYAAADGIEITAFYTSKGESAQAYYDNLYDDAARGANQRQTAHICREILTDAVFEAAKKHIINNQ